MKKNNKKTSFNLLKVAPSLLLGLSLSTTALSAKEKSKINTSANLQLDVNSNEDGDISVKSQHILFNIGAQLSEKTKAKLVLDIADALGREFANSGEDVNAVIDVEKLVDELTLEAQLNDNWSVTVGKQNILAAMDAFGGSASQDLLYDAKRIQQVVGAVLLGKTEYIDEVRFILTESPEGQFDMNISSGDPTVGIAIAHKIGDMLSLQASYLNQEGNKGSQEREEQWSIGAQFKYDENMSAYALVIFNDKGNDGSTTAVQGGAKYKNFAVDGTKTKDKKRGEVSYNHQIKKNLSIKPYVGYTKNDKNKDKDGFDAGVELRLQFD
ncbi:MAG: hypothetical protein D6797_00180 [Bdellovibrio sp.]|nr:MAG: hypothetical protein D6797_00180 [Bdellovibrio sp.]